MVMATKEEAGFLEMVRLSIVLPLSIVLWPSLNQDFGIETKSEEEDEDKIMKKSIHELEGVSSIINV